MRSRRVDILHVIGSFVAAGAERFVVDLALALQEGGHSVGVVALSAKIDSVGQGMRDALDCAGVFNLAGPTGPVRVRSAAWYLATLFRLRPAIVHLHTPNTDLAHYLGTKAYRVGHDLFRTLHNTNIPDSYWYWHAIGCNKVRASIACSAAVKDAMATSVGGEIVVIRNGIRFEWPVRTPRIQKENAMALGLAQDRRHFLSVGRMEGKELHKAAKAHDVLIRAWRDAAVGEAGGILHILGNGELRGALEEFAAGDDSIVFHGVQSGIHRWQIACDGFVMPSRHEGLPIAGIEALGTGLPCIFSDIGPLRELGATAARWVPVNDVGRLAEQLLAATRAPREFPAESAMSIRDAYSMESVARRYAACYRHRGRRTRTAGLSI